MYYAGLRKLSPERRARIVSGLQRLRAQLQTELPAKSLESSLLLASWNLREFDSKKYGGRLDDAFYYIAEVLSHFDLIAIQEVREDLAALETVQRLMGRWWDYLVTDLTYGRQGNGERLAFLFDSRTVRFARTAGEVVLPAPDAPVRQLARTPFLVSFQAGWTQFDLCTVHIYYGQSQADDPQRLAEVEQLATLLAKQVAREPDSPYARNVILLGDFNIFDRETDATMKALERPGFVVPPEIRATKTNALGNKQYDQIAVLQRRSRFGLGGHGGVIDVFKAVFRDEDEAAYATERAGKGSSYKEWRTYQISDHRPLWVELQTNFADPYLASLGA